jgi:hypothetical protein
MIGFFWGCLSPKSKIFKEEKNILQQSSIDTSYRISNEIMIKDSSFLVLVDGFIKRRDKKYLRKKRSKLKPYTLVSIFQKDSLSHLILNSIFPYHIFDSMPKYYSTNFSYIDGIIKYQEDYFFVKYSSVVKNTRILNKENQIVFDTLMSYKNKMIYAPIPKFISKTDNRIYSTKSWYYEESYVYKNGKFILQNISFSEPQLFMIR